MEVTLTADELAATQERVAKFNKLAAKYGLDATVTVTETGRSWKTGVAESGFEYRVEMVDVVVDGTALQLPGGWKLAATLDLGDEGNIFRTNPHFEGQVPAEFRTSTNERCDHCNIKRFRKQAIVVFSETEGFKQVGSDCVKLFLGISPASVLRLFGELAGLVDEDGLGGGFGGRHDDNTAEFIAAAAFVTEQFGFVPKSAFSGRPTADIVGEWLAGPPCSKFKNDFPELFPPDQTMVERANKLAAEALDWIVASTDKSDYITNLRLAAKRANVGRNGGLLASLPNAYKRAMGKVAEQAAKAALPASTHLGAVGDKVELVASVVYTNRGAAYSYYGPESLFVILLGEGGHKVYVNTTVDTAVGRLLEDADKSAKFTVSGTIKALKTSDKGEDITVLTRTKAQEV